MKEDNSKQIINNFVKNVLFDQSLEKKLDKHKIPC